MTGIPFSRVDKFLPEMVQVARWTGGAVVRRAAWADTCSLRHGHQDESPNLLRAIRIHLRESALDLWLQRKLRRPHVLQLFSWLLQNSERGVFH